MFLWDLSLHILLMGVKFSLRSLIAVVLSGEKSSPSVFFPRDNPTPTKK